MIVNLLSFLSRLTGVPALRFQRDCVGQLRFDDSGPARALVGSRRAAILRLMLSNGVLFGLAVTCGGALLLFAVNLTFRLDKGIAGDWEAAYELALPVILVAVCVSLAVAVWLLRKWVGSLARSDRLCAWWSQKLHEPFRLIAELFICGVAVLFGCVALNLLLLPFL